MKTNNNFAGLNSFVWWKGVVENRNDPLKLCRCQVRIFGWHTDNLQLIPSSNLPWAHPTFAVNNSNRNKAPKEGEWVFGYFADGESGQYPIYLGVLPGIPISPPDQSKGFSDQRTANQVQNSPGQTLYPNKLDEPTTSRLYRNENISNTIVGTINSSLLQNINVSDGTSWNQPKSSYNTIHPFNDVLETESGHVMEFDDTPNNERINLYHKSGTFAEFRPDGSLNTKIVSNSYTIIIGTDYVYIEGDCNLTTKGNINLETSGKINIKVSGDCDMNIDGNVNIDISGKLNASATEYDLTGNMNINGSLNVTGNINSDSDVIASDISLVNHFHGNVQNGSGVTGNAQG